MYRRSLGLIAGTVGQIEGRLLSVDLLKMMGNKTCIITVYAPNDVDQQLKFFHDMQAFVTDNTILLGDFNSVTDLADRLSGKLDRTSNELIRIQ